MLRTAKKLKITPVRNIKKEPDSPGRAWSVKAPRTVTGPTTFKKFCYGEGPRGGAWCGDPRWYSALVTLPIRMAAACGGNGDVEAIAAALDSDEERMRMQGEPESLEEVSKVAWSVEEALGRKWGPRGEELLPVSCANVYSQGGAARLAELLWSWEREAVPDLRNRVISLSGPLPRLELATLVPAALYGVNIADDDDFIPAKVLLVLWTGDRGPFWSGSDDEIFVGHSEMDRGPFWSGSDDEIFVGHSEMDRGPFWSRSDDEIFVGHSEMDRGPFWSRSDDEIFVDHAEMGDDLGTDDTRSRRLPLLRDPQRRAGESGGGGRKHGCGERRQRRWSSESRARRGRK